MFLHTDYIITGNCLELFKTIPDNSINIVFADPPFNLSKKYDVYKDNLTPTDYINWCQKWLNESIRVLKPNGSLFIHNIPKWLIPIGNILHNIAYFKNWISWDALSSPVTNMLQPNHYGFLYYTKQQEYKYIDIRIKHKRDLNGCLIKDYGGKINSIHPFGTLISDIWTDIHRIKHNSQRNDHPCQLPVTLLERILLMSTDENDVVLDPFMGTGTTAIAAKRLNRHYIGFDISENYVKIAKENIEAVKTFSKIGDCFVSFYHDEVITLRNCDWVKLSKHFDIPVFKSSLKTTKIQLI